MSDLEKKLTELREIAARENVDIGDDLSRLSAKLSGQSVSSQPSAWQRVVLSRHPERPTTLDYIQRISDHYVELHGDRTFGDDSALVGGIARIGGIAFTFFGHQKGKN